MPNQDGGCKIAGINNLAGFISYDDPAKSMTYEKIGEKNYGDREKKEVMIQSHRDLLVWQRAIQLSTATYKLTAGFPKEELYGLTNQLRRTSVSIASNIAEGYGRGSKGEYKQFLAIARGSNLEVQTQLTIAKELQFAGTASIEVVEKLTIEIDKMLNTLLKKL